VIGEQSLARWRLNMSGTILVVAEAGDGGVRPISLELVTAARKVGDLAGCTVTALLMGFGVGGAAEQLGSTCIERLLVADDPALDQLPTEVLAAVLAKTITELNPIAVLVPSTTAGIEYAPRVAARLDLPIASDCIDLSFEDGAVIAVRPVLGGRVQSAVRLSGGGPVVLTIRQGSFENAAIGLGETAAESFSVGSVDTRLKITGISAKERGDVGLDTAETIVGGGRGLKEATNFALVEQLAAALGGAVAATRAVTDAGWRPHHEQIGQTGRVVSPRLYIAVGISGAAQHVTGLQGADTIVAINRDPDAPIFKIASFGIVGDLFELVPAILAELKATA